MERTQKTVKRWSIEYIDEEGETVLYHFDGNDSQLFEELQSLMVSGLAPTAYDLTPHIESDVRFKGLESSKQ